MEALSKYLSPITLQLDQIFLDPNNPRFTGSEWNRIPDSEIAETDRQETARKTLIAQFDVTKLQASMEINGYLPVDRIVVREFEEGKYVVLEGNRRVCAAKNISKYTSSGEDISGDVFESLKEIPCLQYTGSDESGDAAWVFQGLRHISGMRDWSAFHKAKLLVEQMENEDLTLTEVGQRFGLTPFGAGQWVRGYFAFRQAKADTEYRDAVDDRIYPYFQEIFGRSSIPLREWLEWDDTNYRFKNIAHLNEFVGWFYPSENEEEEAESPVVDSSAWERRIIGKRDDLRQMSFLISEAPKDWMEFRQKGDLEEVYSRAQVEKYERKNEDTDFAGNLFAAIDKCSKLIENTPISVTKNDELKKRLAEKIADLKGAIDLLES